METLPGSGLPTALDEANAAPRRPSLSPARQALVVVAWIVSVLLALIALGRISHLDDAIGWPYPGINVFTAYVYLPAYAALAIGFALRRNRLVAASLVLVALHLFYVLPEVWPGSPGKAPAGAARFRLLTANVRYDNPHAGDLGRQIRSRHPDVVVLEELSPAAYASLRRDGALTGYRYSAVHLEGGAFGSGVFSRFPLSGDATPLVADLPSQRATVTLPGDRRFTLYAIHTLSPVNSSYTRRWRVQFAALRAEALRAKASGQQLVMAGDFNASRDHRPFRRLVDAGLRDSHDAAHAGWAPTWSATSGVAPTTIRLDHVLVSKGFTVTGYATGSRYGSDHLPVITDLALR